MTLVKYGDYECPYCRPAALFEHQTALEEEDLVRYANQRPDHATVLASLALDMTASMAPDGAVGDLGMELRIGINTGPVVRGDLGSRVVRRDYTVIGDTVNQANRYESRCPPGAVLISASTRAALGARAQVSEIAGLELKGVATPVTGYVVESLAEDA